MSVLLTTLLLIVFTFLLLLGITLVPLGLPGTWLIVLDAFLYSLVRDYKNTDDWKVILVIFLLALVGEAVEFAAGIFGAKHQKVPTGAIIASIVGGIIGAIVGVPIFLIGAVLGLLLGTFLGALVYGLITHPHPKEAIRFAIVTLFSRVVSLFAKTTVALVMAGYLLFKVI